MERQHSLFRVISVVVMVVAYLEMSTATSDIRMPPVITSEPDKNTVFRDDIRLVMSCSATGIPRPEFTWKKNGADLDLNSPYLHYIGPGAFEINPTSRMDEGFYQCVATNQYGTVVSNTSHLQRAVLNSDGEKHIKVLRAVEGQQLKVDVTLPLCYPPPTFTWEIGREVDDSPRTLVLSQRLQISPTGELHFAYLEPSDSSDAGYYYKLNVFNSHRDVRAATNYVHINVTRGPVNPFAPTLGFTSQNPAVAVLGGNATLRCFFYGNPAPTITWNKRSGSLPVGRHRLSSHNSELFIEKVEQSDEGDYICRATSSSGASDVAIQVDVQASPVFRNHEDHPYNVNKTEGESVTFQCSSYAEPPAKIVWMRNGSPLTPNSLPANFRLTNENRNLTILNLCKVCKEGAELSGLQVIQCNASNKHGYALGTGYVNVLEETKVVNATAIKVAINNTDAGRFEFPCSGFGDSSTPVLLTWFRVEKNELESMEIDPNKRFIADNGSLIIRLSANDTEGWKKYGKSYRCRVSNGYSEAFRNATINVLDLPPEPEPIVAAGLSEMWWIFVILAVVLLVLILLIFTSIHAQRNKGDHYPVDLKERKNGNDPENELLGYGFQDYQRPSDHLMTGSRTLLGSRSKLDSDDEGGSMNEYGDVDAGKFNEDGSFVGIYNTADKKLQGRSGSLSQL